MLPKHKKKLKFNQSFFARDILGPESDERAHNAFNDVTVMQKIINKIQIPEEDMRNHAKSVSSMLFDLKTPETKKSLKTVREIHYQKLDPQNF